MKYIKFNCCCWHFIFMNGCLLIQWILFQVCMSGTRQRQRPQHMSTADSRQAVFVYYCPCLYVPSNNLFGVWDSQPAAQIIFSARIWAGQIITYEANFLQLKNNNYIWKVRGHKHDFEKVNEIFLFHCPLLRLLILHLNSIIGLMCFPLRQTCSHSPHWGDWILQGSDKWIYKS